MATATTQAAIEEASPRFEFLRRDEQGPSVLTKRNAACLQFAALCTTQKAPSSKGVSTSRKTCIDSFKSIFSQTRTHLVNFKNGNAILGTGAVLQGLFRQGIRVQRARSTSIVLGYPVMHRRLATPLGGGDGHGCHVFHFWSWVVVVVVGWRMGMVDGQSTTFTRVSCQSVGKGAVDSKYASKQTLRRDGSTLFDNAL